MITQVVFKIDKKVKDKAMKRAKDQGVPLAAVLKSATKAYAEGAIELQVEERFNARTRKIIERALKEIKEGKGLSPAFDTAEAAIVYLKGS